MSLEPVDVLPLSPDRVADFMGFFRRPLRAFGLPTLSHVRPPSTAGMFLLAVLLLAWSCMAEARPCSKAEAKAAEAVVSRLKTWERIHAAYHRYSHCDRGAIAQGFNKSVVHHLATQWPTLPEAQRLITRDRAFGAFVVRHVDRSANRRELRLVAEYSAKRCPAGARALCGKLRKAAMASRDQHASPRR